MSATAPATRRRCYDMARRRCRTLAAVRVLDYLYWCTCRHGRATPARAQIAGATGYCERTVTRAVTELETIGAVRVWRDPPHRCDDGTYTRARTNLYRLKWPPRVPKPLVAPRGHGMHHKAATRALEPPAPPVQPALLPPDEPEAPMPEAPSAPPWLKLGITRDEWLARARGAT